MFGDFGQGLVLFILGILCSKKGIPLLSNFKKFSVPLKSVGIASMVMGLLTGSFFANEKFFVAPTRALTEFITGHPRDHVLVILPLAESGGSVTKLFYFFGFTIAVGVILNSIGLIVNIINKFILKDYEKAVFSKTGLAGAIFFWYALFIAIRFILSSMNPALSFNFAWFDVVFLVVPVAGIFFEPALWRLLSGKKPVFTEGLLVFIMEGFVEVLEIVSTYISNTVSFLRVGAFALSHAVLSFMVFHFAEQVSGVTAGTAFSGLIIIIGNLVIILLEGLIVAIQVVRLQYYEFFSKFFVETGVEFNPFRFRKGANV
jgi:V/A-type H+-transporting ATPase subunit I